MVRKLKEVRDALPPSRRAAINRRFAKLLEGERARRVKVHVGDSLETIGARVADAVRRDRTGERVREYHLTVDSLETLAPRRSARDQALHEKAEAERNLCCDWLKDIMRRSSERTRTKADLRMEAMRLFKVSKQSFDFGWIAAIEETGNHRWYEPLPRSKEERRVR